MSTRMARSESPPSLIIAPAALAATSVSAAFKSFSRSGSATRAAGPIPPSASAAPDWTKLS